MIEVDVERFERDGFLSFPKIAGPNTVRTLAETYDRMLAGEIDCGVLDRQLGRKMRQIMEPTRHHPAFLENEAVRNGRAIAAQLLQTPEPPLAFSMLIYKEPGQLAETPWHHDYAYAEMPFTPAGRNIPYDESVQFWMALDDVDEANGCMHFLPGGHLDPLHPHYVAGGEPTDDGRLLAIADAEGELDLTKAVACPLSAGGATVHSFGTPHYTSGNRTTDRPRRAFIFNFAKRGLESLIG